MRFTTKKTKVTFDRDKFLDDFTRKGKDVLKKIGDKLIDHLERNLDSLDEYPEDWRIEMMTKLQNKVVEEMDGFIKQGVGLVDMADNEWAMVRARILEHGTGSKGEDGSGEPVSHYRNVPGINTPVTGWNVSQREDYKLPDGFNIRPGHWFSDAEKLIEEYFADETESFFRKFNPMKYIKIK